MNLDLKCDKRFCDHLKGGFEKFNREVELDKSDEVDREVKDKISNNKWNVRTGNGFGPGFGNIGKGAENMRSDVVQFQKYKMTKDCFLIMASSLTPPYGQIENFLSEYGYVSPRRK